MTKSAAALFDEAMKLSEDDRHELADRLLFTLSPERQVEIDRAWAEEVERRVRLGTREEALKFKMTPPAREELREAYDFYESRQTGLGGDFGKEMARAAAKIWRRSGYWRDRT